MYRHQEPEINVSILVAKDRRICRRCPELNGPWIPKRPCMWRTEPMNQSIQRR